MICRAPRSPSECGRLPVSYTLGYPRQGPLGQAAIAAMGLKPVVKEPG